MPDAAKVFPFGAPVRLVQPIDVTAFGNYSLLRSQVTTNDPVRRRDVVFEFTRRPLVRTSARN